MRVPLRFLPILLLLTGPVLAQTRHPAPPAKPHPTAPAAGPKSIGKFDDWQAATHQEGSQTVCYAFTRAKPDVVLTVAQRPSGRDAVAISAGFAFAANATLTVTVDQSSLEFYTAQRSAFARDGHAAVVAFMKGRQAIAREPAPHNTTVTDSFSLRGFEQAYAAITKACPAK